MKEAKQKSPEEALGALMERCAKAEVCLWDARRLMARWGIAPSAQESILSRLQSDGFIDEARYAGAFVRDKLNFSRWGARKITEVLYQKRIPPEIIRQAMEQAEAVSMADRLEDDLRRKNSSLKEENPYKRKEKLLRFGLSRGYDLETVLQVIEKISTPEADY
jgi:regulatory protein